MFAPDLSIFYKNIRSNIAFVCLTFFLLLSSTFCTGQTVTRSDGSAIIVSPLHPQDSRGETVYEIQGSSQKNLPAIPGLWIAPQPIKMPSPKYPKSLKTAQEIANVTVEGVIAKNGEFIDTKIMTEADPDVRKSVLNTVARYRFKPASLDGHPIAILTQLVIKFRIY